MPLNLLTILDEDSIICVNINNVEMHHVKISEKEKVQGFTKNYETIKQNYIINK